SSFLYTTGTFNSINVPGASATIAEGINDSGQVVGWYRTGNIDNGFLYSNNSYIALSGPIGALGAYVFGINNSGQIVGFKFGNDGINHGFLYNDGNYTTIDVPGAINTMPYGINNRGQIVGQVYNPINNPAGGVPEPSTWAMMILGFAGIGFM